MNDQTTQEPSLTRKLTDAALVIIAVAAIASWLWRRVRRSAASDEAAAGGDSPATTVDDKVGAAVGFPSNSTSP